MKRLSALRVVLLSVGLAAGVAVTALAWTAARYGFSDDSLAVRLEREVRTTVHAQAAAVELLSERVAAEDALIHDAIASRDRLSDLFEQLRILAASVSAGERPVAVTAMPAIAQAPYSLMRGSS